MKKWTQTHLHGDPVIWMVVMLLAIISILVVYSAVGSLAYRNMEVVEVYLVKHSALVVLSLFAMWVAHKVDYRYYSKISLFALIISVPLLIFAWKSGTTINDASRWITIPVIKQVFQPSDLAKLALIASLASMLSKRQQNIGDIKESLIPILAWIGVICALIAMADLSTATLLFATFQCRATVHAKPLGIHDRPSPDPFWDHEGRLGGALRVDQLGDNHSRAVLRGGLRHGHVR